ncbi:MAG: hypothetical protein COA78_30550 [Blastopirellula sp.]|nr:MAG: hypothetical protein COA78_30550 [Blastopirellula sp.]
MTTPKHIQRKVLLDLFAHPGTVIPIALGMTGFLAYWANILGSQGVLLGSTIAIVAGFAWLATKLVFNLEDITKNAYQQFQAAQHAEREIELDKLDAKLSTDGDSRTHTSLRQLRELYSNFQKDINKSALSTANILLVENIEELVKVCVGSLEKAYQRYEDLRSVGGEAREQIKNQREQLVLDVVATVQDISKTFDTFHSLATEDNDTELSRLRNEMHDIMSATQEAMQERDQLDAGTDIAEAKKAYLNQ